MKQRTQAYHNSKRDQNREYNNLYSPDGQQIKIQDMLKSKNLNQIKIQIKIRLQIQKNNYVSSKKKRERQQRKQAMDQFLLNQKQKRDKQQQEQQKIQREEEQKKQKEQQCYRTLVAEEEKRKKADYDKWKSAFQVEESGNIKDSAQVQERKKKEFLKNLENLIKKNKLSLLEDLSHRFKLTTKQVVENIKALEESKAIKGIFDQRGKYLYIEDKEWSAVRNYIQARGRVKKYDIMQQCAKIIKIPEYVDENKELLQLIELEDK